VKTLGNERSPAAELNDEVEEVCRGHDAAARGDPASQDLHGKNVLHASSIAHRSPGVESGLAGLPPGFEAAALEIIQRGLDSCAEPRSIKRSARLLHAYEKDFWDAVAAN
jgi:hypothetical protein